MRVLICRARDEAEGTARKLSASGHAPVVAPVLTYMRLGATLPEGRPGAVAVSSAQAAKALLEAQIDRVVTVPAYAVGASTAAALRHRGFKDVRVGEGDAAMLVDLMTLTLPRPADVLYLAGRRRKPGLADGLAERGYRVQIVEVYDVGPAPPWGEDVIDALRTGGLDACLHYSRDSADLAIAAAMRGGVALPFLALRHFGLSADAAAPLLKAGATHVGIAAHPREDSLFDALDATAHRRDHRA